jgi:cytochrome c
LSPAGQRLAAAEAAAAPVVALTISADGTRAAAASITGTIAIIDRATHEIRRTFGQTGAPLWSIAFLPDSRTLLAGGGDGTIRRWDSETGQSVDGIASARGDLLAADPGDAGAQVFRACAACHTLAANQGERAGPSLHGIFGRRIASLPGYDYSDALKRLDIVWTRETLAKLFDVGPSTFTPGTKMPEQRIGSDDDREALVGFLERATR